MRQPDFAIPSGPLSLHLWVERLTVTVLLQAALALIRRPVQLHFGEAAPMAGRLARWLVGAARGRLRIHRIDLHAQMVDENGRNVHIAIHVHAARMAAAVFDGDASWLPADQRGHAAIWMRALAAQYVGDAFADIAFLYKVESLYRNGMIDRRAAAEVIACLPPGLTAWHTAATFRTSPEAGLRIRVSGLSPVWAGIVAFLRQLSATVTRLRRLRNAAPPEVHLSEAAQQHGILLDHLDPYSLMFYPARGQYDWHDGSGIPADRVALLINRSDTALSPQLRQQIADGPGFGWIHCPDPSVLLDARERTLGALFKRAAGACPRRPTFLTLWRWLAVTALMPRLDGFRQLVRRYKVRSVHMGWDFFPADQLLLIHAARLEGAINVFNLWSCYPFIPERLHRATTDVLFAWGPYDREMMAQAGFEHACVLETGVVSSDGLDGSEAERAQRLRSTLSPDVDFVITLFDTSYGPNCFVAPETVVRFYTACLAVVRDNPRWGCLIKSKGDAFVDLPYHESVHAVVAELERQGRCHVVDGYERVTVAACAADAVVVCGINTAGFMAALCGKRTLHLDLLDLPHPMHYAGANGRILLDDPARLDPALRAIRDGAPEIGDHGPWLHLFDPFGDLRGRHRMGAAMKAYLDARDAGLDAARAIARMAEHHADSAGPQHVFLAPACDSPAAPLWERVLADHYRPHWPPPFPATSAPVAPAATRVAEPARTL